MTKQLPPKKNERDKSLTELQKHLEHLKHLSPKSRRNAIRSFKIFRGPLPPNEVLNGYKDTYRNAPKIIFDNFQQQSNHRRHLEDMKYKNHYILSYITLGGSIFIMILFLVFSFILLMSGHKVVGSIFGAVDIFSVMGSIWISILNNNKDNDKKSHK